MGTMSKFKKPAPANAPVSTIRGTISGPIPIPDDDEFPIRKPGTAGTGRATPLGTEGIEKQLGAPAMMGRDSPLQAQGLPSPRFTPPPAKRNQSPARRPSYESPPRRSPLRRQPSPLRYSAATASSSQGTAKLQRKRSTFRTVFSKMFGKKKAARQNIGIVQASHQRQHRSDPVPNRTVPDAAGAAQRRSVSLPINEFNRALRSHSILEPFPQQSVTTEPIQETVQPNGQPRQRSATTPSRLWTPTKTPGYVDWTGLSPRPASSHARDSRTFTDEEVAAATGIGLAVTSGSHPHRRSRSLGQLRDEARTQVTRRRSDEIKYWRQSYDTGMLSPLSSNVDEEAEAEVEAEANAPRILEDAYPEVVVARDPPQDKPQPFNFGQLEMAGMKITQAASLETRVTILESRIMDMERRWSQGLGLQAAPKNRKDRSVSRHRTDALDSSPSQQCRLRELAPGTRPPLSTHNSYHPDFDNSAETARDVNRQGPRPLSTSTTIRGQPSISPTTVREGSLSMEQYTALNNMISAEQNERQRLENVVSSLQRQLATFIRNSTSSNHDSDAAHAGIFSGFDQDESSDDNGLYSNDEVFRTPVEEGEFSGHDVFPNSEERKLPRKMSLGHITQGTGIQPSVNF